MDVRMYDRMVGRMNGRMDVGMDGCEDEPGWTWFLDEPEQNKIFLIRFKRFMKNPGINLDKIKKSVIDLAGILKIIHENF